MAEWLVVSTFDDQRSLALIQEVHITGAGVTGDTGAYSDVIKGRWVVFPGALFTGTNNLFAFLDLGVDIKAASQAGGNSVTLYLEVTQPTVPDGFGGTRKAIVDVTWGTMNCGPAHQDLTEFRFTNYHAVERITPMSMAGLPSGYQVFLGGQGYSYAGDFEADSTYRIWMVIDYNYGYFESYIQGGAEWPEQTRIAPGDSYGYLFFRNHPADDDVVQYFTVATSTGWIGNEKGKDPVYFDNIAIDTSGENLTQPDFGEGFGTWGPYPVVDAAGNVDTGGWLGWLNVAASPYVWSYTLGGYLYAEPAAVGPGGGWAYVFNE